MRANSPGNELLYFEGNPALALLLPPSPPRRPSRPHARRRPSLFPMHSLFKSIIFALFIGAALAQGPPGQGVDDDDAPAPGPTTTTNTNSRALVGTTPTSSPTVITSPTRGVVTTSSTTRTTPSPSPSSTRTTTTPSSTPTTTSTTESLESSTGVTLVVNPTFETAPYSNTYTNTFMPIPPTNPPTADASGESAGNIGGDSANPAPSGFLQNKVAMGVTFTFVAIAILAGVVSLSALVMRKRRERRLEEFTNEAGWNHDAREKHTSTFGFNDHDQYHEDFAPKRESSHSMDDNRGAGAYSPTQQPSQSNYSFPPAAPQAGVGAYHGNYSANTYPQVDATRNYSSPYGPVATNATRYPFANQFAPAQSGAQPGSALPNHYASYGSSSNSDHSGYPQSQQLHPVRQPSGRKAPPASGPDYGSAW